MLKLTLCFPEGNGVERSTQEWHSLTDAVNEVLNSYHECGDEPDVVFWYEDHHGNTLAVVSPFQRLDEFHARVVVTYPVTPGVSVNKVELYDIKYHITDANGLDRVEVQRLPWPDKLGAI